MADQNISQGKWLALEASEALRKAEDAALRRATILQGLAEESKAESEVAAAAAAAAVVVAASPAPPAAAPKTDNPWRRRANQRAAAARTAVTVLGARWGGRRSLCISKTIAGLPGTLA